MGSHAYMNNPEYWVRYRVAGGGPEDARLIPKYTRDTLTAKSSDEMWYARTAPGGSIVRPGAVSPEGLVAPQGISSEAAEPFIEYVFSLLESGVGEVYGMSVLLRIVADIVGGDASRAEVAAGNVGLVDRCLEIVGDHVEILYQLAESDDEWLVYGAIELIGRLDDKHPRLLDLVERVRGRELRQMNPGSHRTFHLMLDQIRDGTSGLSD